MVISQAEEPASASRLLELEFQQCCICAIDDAEPVGLGEDFEYRTSQDTFLASRCRQCGLVYLNPRPASEELDRIYPATYHAYDFSKESFGFVHEVRRRLEARRVLSYCQGLPNDARILDVGCGDGFHLRLLRDFGPATWSLEGVDASARAVEAAAKDDLTVHRGRIEEVPLAKGSYHLILLIATIEHADNPLSLLRAVRDLLRPGGRVVVVTDNVRTLDFRLFGRRHWGGYHFPRHWNLFDSASMRAVAEKSGLQVESIRSIVSPVNWVYSVRNWLVDSHAPRWLVEQFSLKTPVSLGVFTIVDSLFALFGRGALLRVIARRPL